MEYVSEYIFLISKNKQTSKKTKNKTRRQNKLEKKKYKVAIHEKERT